MAISTRSKMNVRWVRCPVNTATTVAAGRRHGTIASVIFHRVTGSGTETSVWTNADGDVVMSLVTGQTRSQSVQMEHLHFDGLTITNSTEFECWVAIMHEGPSAGALPHPDMT